MFIFLSYFGERVISTIHSNNWIIVHRLRNLNWSLSYLYLIWCELHKCLHNSKFDFGFELYFWGLISCNRTWYFKKLICATLKKKIKSLTTKKTYNKNLEYFPNTYLSIITCFKHFYNIKTSICCLRLITLNMMYMCFDTIAWSISCLFQIEIFGNRIIFILYSVAIYPYPLWHTLFM